MHAARAPPAVLQCLLPSLVIAYFLIAEVVNLCRSSSSLQYNNERPRRIITVLQGTILATYGAEAITLAVDTLCCEALYSSTAGNIYTLLSVIFWTLLFARFYEGQNGMPCFPIWGSWFLSLISEMLLLTLRLPLEHPGVAEIGRAILQSLRLMILVLLLQYGFHQIPSASGQMVDESTPFLQQTGPNSVGPTIDWSSIHETEENSCTASPQKSAVNEPLYRGGDTDGKYSQLFSTVRILANVYSFLRTAFPRHPSIDLHLVWLHGLGVLLSLLAQRALIVVLSLQLGHVTDSFPLDTSSLDAFPSGLLISFFACLYLAYPGFLGRFEDLCVTFLREQGQNSIRMAVHSRASESSETFDDESVCNDTRMMLQQAASLLQLLESVFLQSLPLLLDVVVGHVVLSYILGWYAFLTTLLFDTLYLWATVRLHKSRSSSRLAYLGALSKGTGERSCALKGNYAASTICARNRAVTLWKYVLLHHGTLQSVLVLSCLVAVLVITVYQIMNGRQSIGGFVMIIYYFQNVFRHLDSLGFPDSKQYQWLADAKALYVSFDTQPIISDGAHLFNLIWGEIVFENVGFSCDGRRSILHDLTFRVEPGQQVALVGDSGCGKTTILRLLCRAHDVQFGRIMIDGQDLRDVTRDSFRSFIGIVPQEVPIFDCSVMDNVRRGNPRASDYEVVEACKSANIHEQIITMIDGYNAQIGKYTNRLSGGEKKKIGIARVFLKNPRIVLLDDTLSSFDTETDLSIQKAVRRLISGRTTLVTTCRLPTANNADNFLLISGGSVVKKGAPKSFPELSNNSPGPFKKPVSIESPAIPRGRSKIPASRPSGQKSKTHGSRNTNERSDASASKFKPDAPEFVPNYQRGTEASGNQASHAHPSSEHQTSHKDNKTVYPYGSGQASMSASNDRLAEKSPSKPQAAINESGQALLKSTEEASSTKTEPHYDGQADRASAAKKPHLNRWHRRRQARSDPPAAAVGSHNVEEKKQAQSASPLKARQALRHLSGPGKLLTGHVAEPKTPSNAEKAIEEAPRPRRQRHLRIRKQSEAAASKTKIGADKPYTASSNAAESSSTLTSNTVVASSELQESPSEQGRENTR